MKKRILAAMISGALVLSLMGCSTTSTSQTTAQTTTESSDTTESTADGKVYHVAIIQQLEHPALDLATEGFEQALKDKLGDNVEFDFQNAQGEAANCATIATKFVNDQADLIMANATTALQAVAAATNEIPIVGTSITDYKAAGVIDDNNAPGSNVTGASDLAPVDKQIELLQKVAPDTTQVGILYCSAEPNSQFQAELAEQYLDEAGIAWKEYTVADSNEIQSVVTNMIASCDCVYIPTDNTLASNIEIVKNETVPAKIPVICGEEGMCANGGIATLSISYYDMGYTAGEMAYEILVNGADPATTPISYVSDGITEKYNKEIAEAIEWDMSVFEGMEAIEQ